MYNICFICSYNSLPAAIGARLVVSDNGDNLSPKKAPDTTAPAVAGKDTPRPPAIPIIATPIVPAAPHEVPVIVDNSADNINAVTSKNLEFII